ncbi:MAG: GNAT family N-acetyltransferase [Ruminococcus sp.]|nr:GNAT family N-acetyltransferase [Ruminococcus sp.]MCM1480747.1 GNAT family N-acetyltransferase [Muribaculaceae bacterium]
MNFFPNIARGSVLAQDNTVILTRISESDYHDYEILELENPTNRFVMKILDFSEFMRSLWKDFLSEKAFVCTVRKAADNEFCGYCEINDVTADEPELGIRILKKFHNQGIGFHALKLLMDEYAQLSGKNYFISKVDPKNYASRRLMEKLGGKPDGICDFLIHDEDEKIAFENKYAHLIDDKLIAAAEKFNVSPEKLLSHILRYRIEITK